MQVLGISLQELIHRNKKAEEDNKRKAEQLLTEIKEAPKNTVQMPQVKKAAPVIREQKVIPPKAGGCGCWGNK